MIRKLVSSLASFKSLEFSEGLNILVAERHEESSSKDTRNGTGKTSFVELVHFLVSEKRNKDDDFHKPELLGCTFSGEFASDGKTHRVSKTSGAAKDTQQLDGTDITAKDLRSKLGLSWFGLRSNTSDEKYSPTFGAMYAYFVRKERNGGFLNPTNNSARQQPWDVQVNLAYLLGLDWTIPQRLQLKKDEKKQADALSKMLKSGYLTDGELDLNKMQTRLDLIESEIGSKRAEVMSATVVDGYRQYAEEANELTILIRNLNEANLADLALRDEIDEALAEVSDAITADLESLYNEVGIFFSDNVNKRFDQVRTFHRKVASNRQSHLGRERQNADARLNERRNEINVLQSKLNDRTEILQTGIAVERLTLLQSELNRLEAERTELSKQIPKLRNVSEDQKRLKREIEDLVELISNDVQERSEARKLAVTTFGEVSEFLYDQPGRLSIGRSARDSGLVIDTDIVAKKSGGKNHMQIFCFDWTLAQVARHYDRFPGFLIHDSHIFDGVDGRQIGLALKYASERCSELGIQYIVAMNSDDLQKIANEEEIGGEEIFDPSPYIVDPRLTDQEDGGLFGIRF